MQTYVCAFYKIICPQLDDRRTMVEQCESFNELGKITDKIMNDHNMLKDLDIKINKL